MRSALVALALLLPACGAPAGPGPGPGDPAGPATLTATVRPARLWYHRDQTLTLLATVRDADGELVEAAEVDWTVDPPAAAELAPAAMGTTADARLLAEGVVTFTGCVAGEAVCGALTVRVDDGAPVLEVEAPAPGAELSGSAIVVRGSVADRAMSRVFVNGRAAVVDDRGAFEASVEPAFGVNHVEVVASDGLTDATTRELDVLWAPSYRAATSADGRPEVAFADGLALSLGQGFADDGVPLDLEAEPVVTRDLADLVELVGASLDVTGLVPNPLVDLPPSLTLALDAVDPGTPRAQIEVTDRGLALFLRLRDLRLDVTGGLDVEGTSVDLEGAVTATASLFADVTVRQDGPDAEPEVALEELVVALETLEGAFADDEAQALFALADGLLRRTIEEQLRALLDDAAVEALPALLLDALSALDGALADRELAIETDVFAPVTLRLDGGLERLTPTAARDLRAILGLTVGVDTDPGFPGSPGAAGIAPDAAPIPFHADGAVQLGVRLGLLNGLLHVLWNAGLVDIDLGEVLPDSVASLVSDGRLVGRLPPIVRPPRGRESDTLVLELGQAELTLTVQGEPATFGVQVRAGITLDLDDGALALRLSDMPEIRVWELVPREDPGILTTELIEVLFVDLWPELASGLGGDLTLELPLPSLGDLGGLAPDLAGLQLALELNGPVRVRDGVLLVDARIEGR